MLLLHDKKNVSVKNNAKSFWVIKGKNEAYCLGTVRLFPECSSMTTPGTSTGNLLGTWMPCQTTPSTAKCRSKTTLIKGLFIQ